METIQRPRQMQKRPGIDTAMREERVDGYEGVQKS
jgi:hypothetical protein